MRRVFYYTVLLVGIICPTVSIGQGVDRSLREVLIEIESRDQVTFSYDDELINRLVVRRMDQGLSLSDELEVLSEQTGLSFKSIGSGHYVAQRELRDFCLKVTTGDHEVLPKAQVVSETDASGFITDEEGFIEWKADLTFQDTLVVKYLGYRDRRVSPRDLMKGAACPEVSMEVESSVLKEVTITNYLASGIDANVLEQSLHIQVSDLALLPGETDGDIFLALRTLPGITSPSGKAGNLQMRGGTTDQTLTVFDDIPIYHKGHYYGTISPYNPAIVQHVDVYRSGFQPHLGGRVGGVIKIESQKSIPEKAEFGVGLNSFYSAVSAKVPIAKKTMVAGAARFSYPSSFNSPKLSAITEMSFQPSRVSVAEETQNRELIEERYSFYDLNVSGVHNTGKSQFSFSLMDIFNSLEDDISNGEFNEKVFSNFDLINRGANVRWQYFWNSRVSTDLSLVRALFQNESVSEVLSETREDFTAITFDQSIDDVGVRASVDVLTNEERSSKIQLGYEWNRHEINNRTGQRDPAVSDFRLNIRQISQKADIHALFVNYETLLGQRLSVSGGLRSNYYEPTKRLLLEPRVILNYAVNENWSVKSSGGRYSQFIGQNVYFNFDDIRADNFAWELASENRPVVTSRQFMVGGAWQHKGFLVDLEVYQKDIEGMSMLSPMSPVPRRSAAFEPIANVTSGTMRVRGVDLLVRKEWGNLSTWISYGFLETEMDFDEINQLTFKAYYDQPHVLSLTTTYQLKRWKASLGWQYASGTPVYTNADFVPELGSNMASNGSGAPFTGGMSIADIESMRPPPPPRPDGMPPPPGQGPDGMPPPPPAPTEIPSESYDGRYPSQHQLDVAVVYDFSPKRRKWLGTIGLSVLNVYNQRNLVDRDLLEFGLVARGETLQERYNIGFAPNLMLNFKF